MSCNDCNCNCTTPPVDVPTDPNIRKAIAHLVLATTALDTAYDASEWADHDYALEYVIGELEGLGTMLMENPDLSTLAESLGWSG